MSIPWIIRAFTVCTAFAACVSTYAADSDAGQKTFQGTCAACHKLKSYAGKSDAELETRIHGIIAGTTKHPKKLTLTDADVANVAAYISSNEPK
jgi:mono/diheme cytochrome c family protein